jgi:hypothetical protein
MEILTGNGDRSPSDDKPALTALPRQELHTVTILQTSAKPSDHGLFEPHVRDDMKEEPGTRQTTATAAEQPGPIPGEKGGPFSFRERREEWSAQPQSKSREERLVVENVTVKGRAERLFEKDVSSGAEVGQHHDVMMSSMAQQPLQHPVEPVFNPWKNHGHREAPARTEPTIQVTIGRIEVRAVPPQARSHPKPKGPDWMRLDEYLRGRDGGGR